MPFIRYVFRYMKLLPPILNCLPVIFAVGISHAQQPVLATSGTATWSSELTTTGSRTIFTITGNSVFNWNQLNLDSGSELIYNFTGGESVLNFLTGTGTHFINGSVVSNGNVAFISPNADLEINGSVIARGITFSTLGADATDFFNGDGYRLSGGNGFTNLYVNGDVTATGGDLIVVGQQVVIGDNARLTASGVVGIAGGGDVSVSKSGSRTLSEESGEGFVLHLGETRASRIEVVAGREISNQGLLNAGKGRIFLEVGSDGNITNESGGLIVGNAVFNGTYNPNGTVLIPDEGDAVPVISEGTLVLPALRRPDGSVVSKSTTITNTAAVSASEDAGRDASSRKRVPRRVVAKPLMSRSSFFGMRGGSSAPEKR